MGNNFGEAGTHDPFLIMRPGQEALKYDCNANQSQNIEWQGVLCLSSTSWRLNFQTSKHQTSKLYLKFQTPNFGWCPNFKLWIISKFGNLEQPKVWKFGTSIQTSKVPNFSYLLNIKVKIVIFSTKMLITGKLLLNFSARDISSALCFSHWLVCENCWSTLCWSFASAQCCYIC